MRTTTFAATLMLAATVVSQTASAFPTWIGVYGSYRRHTDESNPGTFTILMNQDYFGLNANVGIQVNGGTWTEYSMSYTGSADGNSIWTHTPGAAYPAGAIVRFYFKGYEDYSSSTIYDSLNAANYAFDIPVSLSGPLCSITPSNGNCVVTWQNGGVLQTTLALTGSWSDVAGAVSPHTAALTNSARFYRIKYPATYRVVDTGQVSCYDLAGQITCPAAGQPWAGQDAQYFVNTPSYRNNGDGTISDLNTGLMWVQARGSKVSWMAAMTGAATCSVGGYGDWRMPTIKELYSLINFSGAEGWDFFSLNGFIPFIDTNYFGFAYGNVSAGERVVDCQDWSSNHGVSPTINGDESIFGVNFADGRIKSYPRYSPGSNTTTNYLLYVRYVRGNVSYGNNNLADNGDGTVTDLASGLMWSKSDSGTGLNWSNALAYAESSALAGYTDWRLPNAKELQSIVDYTRSPNTTASAAINSVFNCTQITNEAGQPDYPHYWSSTTHSAPPDSNLTGEGVYVCFGRAMGYMNGSWTDVHGAGAQRSDPKAGNPADYPTGRGPQGDAIRIYNYVRLVRGSATTAQATDNAADLAYSSGWATGSNGGQGMGAWTLTGAGANGGFFIGSSVSNAWGTASGIDTYGKSFGLYANSGNNVAAYRALSVQAGQTLCLDMDTGWIQAGAKVGFTLRTGNATGSAADYNTGARFEFQYTGNDPTDSYKVIDAAGTRNIGVPFTGKGLRLAFTLTGTDTYTLLVTDNATGTSTTITGTLAGTGTLDSLALFNRNAGLGAAYDVFFNSLRVSP